MSLVDEVKARLSIVDVVSDYVALENLSSRTPKALCPFHDERTPSFSLSLDHESWRCWGACGVGGDIFAFVMRADQIEFKEALEKLARKAGIDLKEHRENGANNGRQRKRASDLHEINRIAEEFFSRQLVGEPGAEAKSYLESRGIDAKAAHRRGIGFAPSGVNSLFAYLRSLGANSKAARDAGLVVKGSDGEWRDMFANRITISIRDQRGNIIGFGARAMGDAQPKYLNTRETAIFDKSATLYGLDWANEAIRASGRAIVVEGYMDVITAHEHGFKNVIACMGTAVTPQQLQSLASVLPENADNPSSIVLCLDADAAGQNAALRGLRVGQNEFRRAANGRANSRQNSIDIRVASPVISSEGTAKDPDEAIRNDSAQWMASINQADGIMEFVIRTSLGRHDVSSSSGQDAALSDIEPYFENLPPHTIAEQRVLNDLSAKLNMDSSHLKELLVLKRSSRVGRVGSNVNPPTSTRARGRRKNRSVFSPTVMPMSTIQASWEMELLARMVQHTFAIDHAAIVEPHHFVDSSRSRVFESLRRTGSFEDSLASLQNESGQNESGALDLLQELQYYPIAPDDAEPEGETEIIQATEWCAQRTRKEYLIRNKKREVQLARKNGNILSDDDLGKPVETNRQIRELDLPHSTVAKALGGA